MGARASKTTPAPATKYSEQQTHTLALQTLRRLRDQASKGGEASVSSELLEELVEQLEETSAAIADQQGALAALQSIESTLDVSTGSQSADRGIRDFLVSNYTARTVRVSQRKATRKAINLALSAHEWVTRLLTVAEVPERNLPDFRGIMADFETWHFDIFRFQTLIGTGPVQAMAYATLEASGLFDALSVSRETAMHFFALIDDAYLDNMYHNKLHGADVGQGVYFMIKNGGIGPHLSRPMKFAVIVAGLVHDVAHPGYNNPFLVASSHELAVTYNDKSPLENMHASLAFKLMLTKGCDILESLDAQDKRFVRSTLIETILATDNGMHASYLARLVKSIDLDGCDAEQPDNLLLLMCNVVHAVDVSNPTKQFGLYMTWTNRLVEEFFVQGDQEKALGLPITPIMNRAAPIPTENLQAGFIKAIVLPLYKTLNTISYLNIKVPLTTLESNLSHWEMMIRKKAEEAAERERARAGSGASTPPASPALTSTSTPASTEASKSPPK